MRTYVIYEAESGNAVHLHIEEPGLRSTSEEVLQAAGFPTDGRFAVRAEEGELSKLQQADDTGMGGAVRGFGEPDVERRYERLDRPRK